MSPPGVSGVPMKSAPHRQDLLAERRATEQISSILVLNSGLSFYLLKNN
jgi:hypothetical protein